MKFKTSVLIICTIILFLQICNAMNMARGCYTPSYKQGECINIEDCNYISKLQANPMKTRTDNIFFRDSVCKIENKKVKVCCEIENEIGNCTTPDKKTGNCISVFDCPSLESLSRNHATLDDDKRKYLNESYCNGHSMFSVCCKDFMKSREQTSEKNLLPPRTECGRHINQQRLKDIVNGETDKNQYPWMALIEFKNNRNISSYNSYGILINPRYVLTNANVLTNPRFTPINVIFGIYDISTYLDCKTDCVSNDRVAIENKIPHPMFDAKAPINDIGLIRMARNVEYTDSIRPICLPQMNIAEETNDPPIQLIVSGWNLVIGFRKEPKNKLHMKVLLFDNTVCENKMNITFSPYYLCIGVGKNLTTCKGDSSAPLMRPKNDQLELTGILSFGPALCTNTGIPDGYVNVYTYIDWIKENLEI